ncbi:unnamed protein product [Ectocarpus sp. 4 AP-2014]
MPRSRKKVARFDPSPEAVASWNDTSLKTRVVVDLQARVRLGLCSPEGAAAAIAAARREATAAAAAAEQERAAALALRRPGGRKRQRSGGAAAGATSEWPPPISGLRAGHRGDDQEGGEGGGGSFSAETTDSSSTSCGTSGSDSESCSSYASQGGMPPSSTTATHQRLAWQPPHSGAAAAGGGGGRADGSGGGGAVAVAAAAAAAADMAAASAGNGTGTASPNGKKKSRTRNDYEEVRASKKQRRNVVTVKLARSQMPSRWATPPPPFETCLRDVRPADKLGGRACGGGGDDAAAAAAASVLGLGEGDVVDAKNWLSSGFIDVVMAKFARTYTNVHFMPIDFAVLCLNGWGASDTPPPAAAASGGDDGVSESGGDAGGAEAATAANAALADQSMVFKDVLGRPIVYSEKRPVIFLTHVNNVHWNLLRVEHDPVPELQLFEPMGKPPRRQGGSRYTQQQVGGGGGGGAPGGRSTGFRCIPKEVYRWLDAVWPLRSGGEILGGSCSSGGGGSKRKAPSPTPSHGGWASRAYSAVTRQQQTTGFDCGVASLLYAEKCGQGQMREDVDAWTTQADMTEYRRALQRYVEEVLRHEQDPPTSSGSTRSPENGAASPEVVVVDPPLPLPASAPLPPAAALAVPAATASAPSSLSPS